MPDTEAHGCDPSDSGPGKGRKKSRSLVEPAPPQGLHRQPLEPIAVPGGATFRQRTPTGEVVVSWHVHTHCSSGSPAAGAGVGARSGTKPAVPRGAGPAQRPHGQRQLCALLPKTDVHRMVQW